MRKGGAELPGFPGHFRFLASRGQGQADDKQARIPLADAFVDPGPGRSGLAGMQGHQGPGNACERIAERDADSASAVVESQDMPVPDHGSGGSGIPDLVREMQGINAENPGGKLPLVLYLVRKQYAAVYRGGQPGVFP